MITIITRPKPITKSTIQQLESIIDIPKGLRNKVKIESKIQAIESVRKQLVEHIDPELTNSEDDSVGEWLTEIRPPIWRYDKLNHHLILDIQYMPTPKSYEGLIENYIADIFITQYLETGKCPIYKCKHCKGIFIPKRERKDLQFCSDNCRKYKHAKQKRTGNVC